MGNVDPLAGGPVEEAVAISGDGHAFAGLRGGGFGAASDDG